MTIVRELIALFGFDVDTKGAKDAQQAYGDVKKGAEASSKAFADAAAGAKGTLKDLSIAVSAIVGGVSFAAYKVAKSTADAAGAAVDTADRLGLAVTTLQELTHAAVASSASAEELVGGLKNLGKVSEDARRGEQGAAESMARIGVRATDAHGKTKPLDDLLGEVADKFAAMPADARSTTLALDLFGKSGLALLPLLRGGSAGIADLRQEAIDLGVVMSDSAARGAKEVGDELGRTFDVLTGLRNVVGLKLLPIFKEASERFRAWAKANREIAASKIAATFAVIYSSVSAVWRVFRAGVAIGDQVVKMLGGIERVAVLAGAAVGLYLAAKVGALAQSLVELGSVGLRSWLKATIVPVLIGAAFLAMAALIFLVWDEVTTYLRGGKTIIGDLEKSFLMESIKPNDHPLVIALKIMLDLLGKVGKATAGLSEMLAARSVLRDENADPGARKQAALDIQARAKRDADALGISNTPLLGAFNSLFAVPAAPQVGPAPGSLIARAPFTIPDTAFPGLLLSNPRVPNPNPGPNAGLDRTVVNAPITIMADDPEAAGRAVAEHLQGVLRDAAQATTTRTVE